MAKDATVGTFSIILIGLLTQYDMAESKREMRRGGRGNIYRLGHLFKAAQNAEDCAKHFKHRSDPEAISAYRVCLGKSFIWEHGQFALSPLRKLDKMMSAWLTAGKFPRYPTTIFQANQTMSPMHMMRPAWKAVFE